MLWLFWEGIGLFFGVPELFELSARYEYMFWDLAWRLEKWPSPE